MENYDRFKDIVTINELSKLRKHRQIVNSVLNATRKGSLKLNDKLPSVNELAFDCNISRDTVVRAYAFLKENDIIDSIPGKGYYIKSIRNKYNVLLIFDSLSPYMKQIHDAFKEALQYIASVDLCIYQNNFDQFKKQILYSHPKEYTHYVIVSNFDEEEYRYIDFLENEVPAEKLILLNKGIKKFGDDVACVNQIFELEFLQVLEEISGLFRKYKGVRLVRSKNSKMPIEIKNCFKNFCKRYKLDFDIIEDVNNEVIQSKIVYVDFENDESLTNLLKKINQTDFVIGSDIGIISYDHPLKELLAGGITVITQIFEKLGYQLANMILNNEENKLKKSLNVIIRNSL